MMLGLGIPVALIVILAFTGCPRPASEVGAPDAALEFRLAFQDEADCRENCQAYEAVDLFGKSERVYAPATASLSIPVDQIVRAQAWSDGESPWMLRLLLSDGSASELSTWARTNASQMADRVLVAIDGSGIGVMRGVVLNGTSSVVVVPIRGDDELEAISERIAVMEAPLTDVPPADGKSTCSLLAGSDEALRRRCESLLEQDVARENEVLDRVDSELDSENPDYDKILEKLGVHQDPSQNPESAP